MFYLIEDENLTKKTNEWFDLRQKRFDEISKIAKKHGSSKFVATDDVFIGIYFDKKPGNNWVKTNQNNCYRPHGKHKAAELIRDDFNSIKRLNPNFEKFSHDNFNSNVWFDEESNLVCFFPAIRLTKDKRFVLRVPDYALDYKPAEGIREITSSEYRELT